MHTLLQALGLFSPPSPQWPLLESMSTTIIIGSYQSNPEKQNCQGQIDRRDCSQKGRGIHRRTDKTSDAISTTTATHFVGMILSNYLRPAIRNCPEL